MARYTGPATKKARAFGEAIYGPDKSFDRKNMHRVSMDLLVRESKSLTMLCN